jgi:hypothetical protein
MFVPHDPKIPYNVPLLPRGEIPRDEKGLEIRREGPPPPSPILGLFGRSNGIEECYEPGRDPADFRPYGAAKLIPAGTDVAINVHYTPNGTAVTDHVQIGFTVAKEPPKRRYLALSGGSNMSRDQFAIPPYADNWVAPPAEFTFAENVELVGLMPHMHVRGKSARFYLDHPDGKSEIILDMPKYDFNWQQWFDTSIKVSKGTKLRVIASFDNSPNNKYNPDPSQTVYYGDQTWEEMHFPSFGVVVDDLSWDQKKVLVRPQFGGPPPQQAPQAGGQLGRDVRSPL